MGPATAQARQTLSGDVEGPYLVESAGHLNPDPLFDGTLALSGGPHFIRPTLPVDPKRISVLRARMVGLISFDPPYL